MLKTKLIYFNDQVMTSADVQLIDRIRFQKHAPQSRCMIEIFRGGGRGGGWGGYSSEGCLKWGGGGGGH